MKKYFAFSDVHGCYTNLVVALEAAGFDENNSDHVLLGVGDYFDRGSESKELYEFLVKFQKLGRGFYLMGNHDEMLYSYLTGSSDGLFDFTYNGMWKTVQSFSGLKVGLENAYLFNESARDQINRKYGLKSWIRNMPLGYTLDNYVFTHAGLKYDIVTDHWVADTWARTDEFVKNFEEENSNKVYVFGHWHAQKLNAMFKNNTSYDTFTFKNFVGLDGMTNKSGKVNVLVVETDAAPEPFEEYKVKYWEEPYSSLY